MSDDDPNPRASDYVPRGPNRDLRSAMREQLRGVGIELDDPAPRIRATAPTAAPPIDRDAVRAILSAAGATDAELAWLVPSCPSLELARAWRPRGYVEPEQPAEAPAPATDPEPQPTPAPQRGWPKIKR